MASEESTDLELVRRVQGGDKRAFDALFVRHQHKIAGLISRYVRDREDVADLVQEVFIKAYRALPRFRGDSAFYTWVFRIAINTSKNYVASRGRQPAEANIDIEDDIWMAANCCAMRMIPNRNCPAISWRMSSMQRCATCPKTCAAP